MSSVYYLIEGGPALDLLQAHRAEKLRAHAEATALLKDLGVKHGSISLWDGTLASIDWPDAIPQGWTKPTNRRGSRPKRGTEWAKRFAAQKGWARPAETIAKAFNIPLNLQYQGKHGHGGSCIGSPLNECGFLWLTPTGPYAMWIPDVQAAVAAKEAEGWAVSEPAKSFKFDVPGCRPILHEEWKILVLEQEIKDKKEA